MSASFTRFSNRLVLPSRRQILGLLLAGIVLFGAAQPRGSLLPDAAAQQQERLKAPEFDGAGDWLNTDKPLTLQQLKGKIVVLDFWTLC